MIEMKRFGFLVLFAAVVCVISGIATLADAATVTWWYDVKVTGIRYLYNPATGQVDQTPLSHSGLAKIEFNDAMRGGSVVIQTPVLGYTEGSRTGWNFSGERAYAGMVFKTSGVFGPGKISGTVVVDDLSKSGSKGHYEYHFHGVRKN